ncbi:CD1108 family mobile element protein [Butyrivibrio sp. INlla16]|uniref:CD1108 family mobile element protein n=1 Tax=Butyrivibrio sp. INlla16 TaxID=1520807 RepID=UPI00111333E0|nr:peptidoglycan DD-metalloendopeptidase family protein [Butyrivibrio sp. INlla16]
MSKSSVSQNRIKSFSSEGGAGNSASPSSVQSFGQGGYSGRLKKVSETDNNQPSISESTSNGSKSSHLTRVQDNINESRTSSNSSSRQSSYYTPQQSDSKVQKTAQQNSGGKHSSRLRVVNENVMSERKQMLHESSTDVSTIDISTRVANNNDRSVKGFEKVRSVRGYDNKLQKVTVDGNGKIIHETVAGSKEKLIGEQSNIIKATQPAAERMNKVKIDHYMRDATGALITIAGKVNSQIAQNQQSGESIQSDEIKQETAIVKSTAEKVLSREPKVNDKKLKSIIEANAKSGDKAEGKLSKLLKHKDRLKNQEDLTVKAKGNTKFQKVTGFDKKNPKSSKDFQKQLYRKKYARSFMKKRYGKAASAANKKAASNTSSMMKSMKEAILKALKKSGTLKWFLAAGLVAMIGIILIMGLVMQMAMIGSDSEEEIVTWQSEPTEIDKAASNYSRMECDLQDQIDSVPTDFHGFDEYNYDIGEIQHDPFVLLCYLSAKYGSFTADAVQPELESLFAECYQFSAVSRTETRYRDKTDADGNVIYDEDGNVEQESYEVKILDVTVTSTPLTEVVEGRMNAEEKGFYDVYMATKGNLQQFSSPLELDWYSTILYNYGYQKNPVTGVVEFHNGIDISVAEGTKVQSVRNGTVVETGYAEGFGNYISISSSDGYVHKYGHLSEIKVSAGQSVATGQTIGKTGSTSSIFGSELYVELMYNGKYMNPLFYMQNGTDYTARDNTGKGSGVNVGDGTPPESYSDATVQRLMDEAEKYLGTDYHLPGEPPDSFDCGCFVTWVFTKSGVKSMASTSAQGIYNQCTPISPDEAKAGDLIFFQGTYNNGRTVTHVGIYCGNGVMIHAGDPVKYSNINTTYWQQHFYSFGRLS